MLTFHHSRLSEALEGLTQRVARVNRHVTPGGGGVQAYDVLVTADSLDYNYDLAKSWVTPQRWSMLTKQYLNAGATDQWLDLIQSKMQKRRAHGVAFLRSQIVKPRVTSGKPARQWGSCMIGWSFRVFPTPTLVMHSRSTYLGFLAPLDLGVAATLGEMAGKEVGLSPEEIGFAWHIDQITFHTFRSMPWWYSSPRRREWLHEGHSMAAQNANRLLRRFRKMDSEGTPYSAMPYAQERRFRMKWHEAEDIDPTPFLDEVVSKPLPKNQSRFIKQLPFILTNTDDEEVERGYDPEDEE